MIISAQELKDKHKIFTSINDEILQMRIDAVETSIRKVTHNNFQNKYMRMEAKAENNKILGFSPYFKIGDTIEISKSYVNDGLYIINQIDNGLILNNTLYDTPYNLVTKIVYPLDVIQGAIDMLKWMERNEAFNDLEKEKPIQSETISRHSITYASDSTDLDIDPIFGVPYKYTSFLKRYIKARF